MIALLLPFWRYIAGALIAAAVVGGIYAKGRNDEGRAWRAKEAATALAAAKKRAELQAQVDTLSNDLEAARARRQVITRTITKEVPRYVQSPAPVCADAGLHSGGFRVLHDAAAAGVDPDPAGVAAAAPVDAGAAAETIAGNYGTCGEWRAQVIGWQRWYEAVGK